MTFHKKVVAFQKSKRFCWWIFAKCITFSNCARVAQNCARVAQNCARVAQNCFSDRFVLVALKSDTFQKTHKKITIFTNSDRFAIFHAFSIKKD
jgi:hypothetical protein